MRKLLLSLLALPLLVAACTSFPDRTTAEDGASIHARAARAHDVFTDDFKNAGRQEQAQYHAEKAREERQKAVDSDSCFFCVLLEGLIESAFD